ncbi:MAG: hypothetical protein HYW23_03925 [Candidatus Aenigmarchaeota archaeon]|nr:hypothetical protein [Candidatus Aenigmarchaeota archaeon]
MPLEELIQLPFPDVLYKLVVPFLFVFLLLYGSLRLIKIFSNNINIIISLALAVLIANNPIFIWLSELAVYFGATTVIAAFSMLFVIGIIMFSIRKGRDWRDEWAKLEDLEKKRAKLLEKLEKADRTGKTHESASYHKQIDKMDDDIKHLRRSIELKRT